MDMAVAPFTVPTLTLNLRTLQLTGPQGRVDVSDPECSLLFAFSTSKNRRLETTRLLEQVGKDATDLGKRALEVQIVRLRKKLKQAGFPDPTIKSIRGMGYQLCLPIQIHHSP